MAKTGNNSVRFDEGDLAVFKKKNPDIDTAQKVVDKLLSWYRFWADHASYNIPDEQQVAPVTTAPVTTKQFTEEFKPEPVISEFDAYHAEILRQPSPKHIEALAFLIKADKNLSPQEKQKLEMIAREFSKTFEF